MKTKPALIGTIAGSTRLMAVLLLLALPAVAQTEDYTCATNNGSLTITSYDGPGGVVIIPDNINSLPVTGIGDKAFYGCGPRSVIKETSKRGRQEPIYSITIPNSVTSIGNGAFESSTKLTNATIGKSVTTIGKRAFFDCTRLTDVKIPDSATNIGMQAFAMCVGLTNVMIGNSVTSIGDYAFDSCQKLAGITIPDSVTSIGSYAFSECFDLTNVTIGNNITSIGIQTFSFCKKLASVTIPSNVTNIEDFAFDNCASLTKIYFKGNAPSISRWWHIAAGADVVTVYYLPGTTGWGATFGGRPTALWKQ